MNQQYASIGISLPILDWGRGKGRVRVARSNVDLVDTQAEQGMKDFELNVCKMVRQFNLQAYRVAVAAKTEQDSRPAPRCSTPALYLRKIDNSRPQCRHYRKRYRTEKLYNSFENLLESVLWY